MTAMTNPASGGTLIHYALPYTTTEDYVEELRPFLNGALAAGEPALVFAPGPNMELLRAAVGGGGDQVTFLDAADLARNPARIIPAARRFAAAHPGRRIRIVGEPIWPGRSTAEIREGIRHEACVNVLFADIAATVLCPYNTAHLDTTVLTAADQTHPHRAPDGQHQPNAGYVDPLTTLATWDDLSAAPDHAELLDFHHGDLPMLRHFVQDQASRAGLSTHRTQDLQLAVNEAASNTLTHTNKPGMLRTWWATDALVCEVSDHGRRTDPLVGRREPPADTRQGRGLWTVNQICDLVELRSGTAGTTTRMRMNTH